jgi:chromate reductase
MDMPTLAQPELYIGHVASLLNEHGEVSNEDTRKLLQKFVDAFATWIEANIGLEQQA